VNLSDIPDANYRDSLDYAFGIKPGPGRPRRSAAELLAEYRPEPRQTPTSGMTAVELRCYAAVTDDDVREMLAILNAPQVEDQPGDWMPLYTCVEVEDEPRVTWRDGEALPYERAYEQRDDRRDDRQRVRTNRYQQKRPRWQVEGTAPPWLVDGVDTRTAHTSRFADPDDDGRRTRWQS